MGDSKVGEQKAAVLQDLIPVMSKITDHKLNGSNYLDWSKSVRLYLRSIDKDNHMVDDPPKDESQRTWLRDDARLFLQIKNSIDNEVIGLITHCEFVKDLMDYLGFIYSGKGNISRIYEVCKAFYRTEKHEKSLTSYFMDFKRTYEELNMLLPFSSDVKVQRQQREQMAVMSFLAGLPPEFETAKAQVLSGSEISSLQEVFSRVLRTENTPCVQTSGALVSRHNNVFGRSFSKIDVKGGGSNRNSDTCTQDSGAVVCRYCHKPGHTKRDCWKLQNRTLKTHSAHVASTNDTSERSILISGDEFVKFSQYQETLKHSCTPTTAINSGKPNTCLVSSSSKWVIDSGATDHMAGNSRLFSTLQSHTSTSNVTLADGSSSSVLGSGTVTPTPMLPLSSVLHLPKLSFNLISVSQLTRHLKCFISFFPDHCVFQDLMTKKIIGRGHESGGLYILDTQIPKSLTCSGITSPFETHCRLGHPSLPLLKILCPQFSTLSSLDCESCQFAKHHRLSSSPRINKRASFPFELVHSDVWGPCPVMSKTGFKYFVTFVDDYSRVTWLYFMKNRSELFSHFCAFHAEIKTQFNVLIRTLRSDNAKEYLSTTFQTFMLQNGILHQTSCVDTPSQNGVAERKNRHLLETARAILFQMGVPKIFWADAISTACFLINRIPSSVLRGETPYQILFPNKSLFPIAPKIFGCTCFVRDVRPNVTKLDPKSLKCVFLGYSRLQKGYRCFCPSLNKYFVSADVTFLEDKPYFPSSDIPRQGEDDDLLVYSITSSEPVLAVPAKPRFGQVYSKRQVPPSSAPPESAPHESALPESAPHESAPPESAPHESAPHESVPLDSCPPSNSSSSDPVSSDDLPIALRKGRRHCTYPVSSFISYNHLSSSSCSFIASLDSVSIPKTVHEAITHPEWHHAMIEEMNALDDNGTWNLVDLPSGKRAIGCKWIFTVKVNPDGSVARLKARLVAKGYAQTYGVDYSDTFSPVAKLTSVRLFISLAATHNWALHQLDIKNAFLHGDLQEEVYMEQPPGFVAQGESGKVCHLRKSLYGLKQSPRAWFGKFSQAVETFGMKKSKSDHSVFYKNSKDGMILLVVYVDDIVITGSDTIGISSLKSFLHTQFHTKDLGMLKYFLGVEVTRCKKGIFLSQRKYVLDLLTETGKLGAKPCSMPMLPNTQLTGEGDRFEDPERYRRLVGKLNYLTVTRPDIAYCVSIVSQFMSAPTVDHWAALEQILCYLKGAPGRGILYANYGHNRIECFSDADWAGSKVDRRSTTGYCVFVGGNLVSWKSKKQTVVSRSSAESEYRAMAQSTCEVMWIYHLLDEVGLTTSVPAKLWCDNQAAIHIASNPVFHERTKHIEIDCHFVREKIQQGMITTGYVKTGEQLGDIFTKALNGVRVDYLCNKLGMINIYAPT